jgi:hypothetical protein
MARPKHWKVLNSDYIDDIQEMIIDDVDYKAISNWLKQIDADNEQKGIKAKKQYISRNAIAKYAKDFLEEIDSETTERYYKNKFEDVKKDKHVTKRLDQLAGLDRIIKNGEQLEVDIERLEHDSDIDQVQVERLKIMKERNIILAVKARADILTKQKPEDVDMGNVRTQDIPKDPQLRAKASDFIFKMMPFKEEK